jgi:hypothetical protein
MSDASLSDGAWAILRALVVGIQIRESVDGWSAFGIGQRRSAGVDSSHISELLASGFIAFTSRGSESFVTVSESGLEALKELQRQEIREFRKCLKSAKLEPKTC